LNHPELIFNQNPANDSLKNNKFFKVDC
jgi:hypothetical protein